MSAEIESHNHICSQSINLNLKLQRANETIAKLQKRCSEKKSEIDRLRSALKRAKLSKFNYKELLEEIKEKNMISEEGHHILQV